MYAIITSGGKQHRITKGDLLKVEQIDANVGAIVEFDKVLMISDQDKLSIGNPYLSNAKVIAEVVEHGRGKKVHILKFRRRKHYLKRQGHRQNYTSVKINDIVGEDIVGE